jgi:predicted metallo-beta-lactamase superfamily hydrolase
MLKINPKFMTINGKRIGIYIARGPWVTGVDPTTIKITPRRHSFPPEVAAVFKIENNSDSQTDYFERDSIRITADHPLYDLVKKAA